MASLLRLKKSKQNCLLFAGALGPKRTNGTIHVSYDDGKTWPIAKTLVLGAYAYSILVELPDGTIGDLYEADNYASIKFMRFPLSAVTDGMKN